MGIVGQKYDTLPRSEWYVGAMEQLVGVVEELSFARSLEQVMGIVRTSARQLTGADGATFVLRDGDCCYYAEENAISPLWKGQRFPLETCISGWVMINAKPAVIEDIYKDPRIPADAYRPTFVKSLAMVPIRNNQPVAAIGNYWATIRKPTAEELDILQALAHVTAVAMENTELYANLQQQIKALQQSNQELSSFAWAVAHDLKSPLRAIDNLSGWIEEELRVGSLDEAGKHIDMLRKRVRRMEHLLDAVFEYSHVEKTKDADSAEVVCGETVLEDLESLVNIPQGFTLRASPEFQEARVLRLPMARVLACLIDNAIRHHDKSLGWIELSVSEEKEGRVFSVQDDGPGIPPAYHQKIFEMFQTLKPKDFKEGSGMGLPIARKIVEAHSGTMWVEHDEPRGSIFRFTWPETSLS